ncbi:MAG TPA: alkaline phosphatase D family protein [Acidimicrobiales bacterium]
MSPFAHGVASFDPLTDRVLLWTRVDPSVRRVRWAVAAAPADPHASAAALVADVMARGEAEVPADADGCVTVDVDGLEPATTHHFWFEVDGVRSPVGRTRTLPVATDWARLAFVCCADRSMGELTAYRAIAEDEVDLVVHLGDYLYEEPKGPHPVDPPGVTVTLEDYRRRHAHTRLDPDLQALHLRHPMVFVWDDHDTADNSWRHGAKAHDEAEHGPWEVRLAAATRARQEWLPARLSDPAQPIDMHRSVPFGELAELVVLDTRIPGRDRPSGDEGAKPLRDPDRRIVPEVQMEWVEQRLADRSRTWAIVASQVPVAPLQLPVPTGTAEQLADSALPSGYRVIDGDAVCTDLWDGYPVQRDRLARALDARAGSAVVVSGDVHSNWAALVPDPTGERAVAADLVTSSVSATAMGEQLPHGWRSVADEVADRRVPHTVWSDLEHHGYLRVDVRPEELRADWIAAEPGERPLRPRIIASWALHPHLPVELRPAVPSSSISGFHDVRRPGLALPPRPAEPPTGDGRSVVRSTAKVGAAVLAGLVVLGIGGWLLRRRRR